jgi:hypothetical protein
MSTDIDFDTPINVNIPQHIVKEVMISLNKTIIEEIKNNGYIDINNFLKIKKVTRIIKGKQYTSLSVSCNDHLKDQCTTNSEEELKIEEPVIFV